MRIIQHYLVAALILSFYGYHHPFNTGYKKKIHDLAKTN